MYCSLGIVGTSHALCLPPNWPYRPFPPGQDSRCLSKGQPATTTGILLGRPVTAKFFNSGFLEVFILHSKTFTPSKREWWCYYRGSIGTCPPERCPVISSIYKHPTKKFLFTLTCSFLMFAVGKGKTCRIPWKIKGDCWSNMQHRQNPSWFRRLIMWETWRMFPVRHQGKC